MKRLFLLSFICVSYFYATAQLSLSDTISDNSSFSLAPNDGKLDGYYPNGNKKYKGSKHKEDLHGSWTTWYRDGQLLDTGLLVKGIPDDSWTIYYPDGTKKFIRTYSFDKWQLFQNEKVLYHPKRISLPVTKLFHESPKQAEKYIKTIHSFCAKKNCGRVKEDFFQTINNNTEQEHYHPLFENGLLHGPFSNYFPDGSLKDSGIYKNGLPEGIWIKWTDDKQFYWHGHYHHGVKNKEWKLYAANGRLIRILFFKEGKYLWRKDIKEGVEHTEEETSGF